MIAKHEFNRRAVDEFLKSIHPINKRTKCMPETRIIDSPAKVIMDMIELSFSKTSLPSSPSQMQSARENSPLRTRLPNKTISPCIQNYGFIRLVGSPLNLTRRNATPMPMRTKPKRIVTRLPFVKWTN